MEGWPVSSEQSIKIYGCTPNVNAAHGVAQRIYGDLHYDLFILFGFILCAGARTLHIRKTPGFRGRLSS